MPARGEARAGRRRRLAGLPRTDSDPRRGEGRPGGAPGPRARSSGAHLELAQRVEQPLLLPRGVLRPGRRSVPHSLGALRPGRVTHEGEGHPVAQRAVPGTGEHLDPNAPSSSPDANCPP